MAGSLSGTFVSVETKIFVNFNLTNDRQGVVARGVAYAGAHDFEEIMVPEGHVSGGVDSAMYDGYRKGLDSACVDVVITTVLPDGVAAVLASKRASGKLFGNKWWMQGGAIHSYRRVHGLLVERAEKECGARPRLEGFIGVFRTCAEDMLGATTNLCYVGFVPYDDLGKVKTDQDHTGLRLLTLEDCCGLPEEEKHWYPMYTFIIALKTMPLR